MSKWLMVSGIRRLNLCVSESILDHSARFGSSWKRRVLKQEELKNVVFQYVGNNARRAERIYVWGCSTTGALGQHYLVLIIFNKLGTWTEAVFFCNIIDELVS
jgi:hypothetical protein